MARLLLKFDDRVIDEYGLGLMVTIGRTPDNVVTIDNPAVSSHHACVFRDGDEFVLEDFESTNGTFVNDRRVSRHILQDGDVILVGKHILVFDRNGDARPVDADGDEPSLAGLRDTVYLDAEHRRKLLARLAEARAGRSGGSRPAPPKPAVNPAVSGQSAILRVITGRTDRSEYRLVGQTSFIGKADTALVRLHGWFRPAVATAITRTGDGYTAIPIRGKTLLNGDRLSGRRALKHGDILDTSGIRVEFRLEA